MDDDIEENEDLEIDMGILEDSRLDNSHRKPAVRISPNNPVRV